MTAFHQTVALLVIIGLLGASSFTVTPRPPVISLSLMSAVAPPEAVTGKKAKPEKITKEAQELLDVLEGKTDFELIVAQTAPSVRVAFPEEFGLEPGSLSAGHLISCLKILGFDLVLDTNTAADLTICEEGTELLHKLHDRLEHPENDNHMPLFSSCCPGWLQLVEKSYPDMAQFISSCKSPHIMYGAMVKAYSEETLGVPADKIYFCSVMPCVRKRGESDRPAFERGGIREVDNVITTKDLGILCRRLGIKSDDLKEEKYDSPFRTDGEGTGAGQLFGATGGVMEAAVRTVYEVVTGEVLPHIELEAVRGLDGVKEATLPLHKEEGKGLPIDLKIAVVNGLGEAKKLVNKIKDGEVQYDFVEVMACPGGCIGGGGQPKGEKDALSKRLDVIYKMDRALPRRRSHLNPVVKAYYENFLGEYGSDKAHEHLHVEPVYGTVPQVDE